MSFPTPKVCGNSHCNNNMRRVDVFFFGFFVVSLGMGNSKGSDSEVSCQIAWSAAIHAHFVAMPFATQLQTCPVCFSWYTHYIYLPSFGWFLWLNGKRMCVYIPYMDPMGYFHLQGAAGLYGMGHLVWFLRHSSGFWVWTKHMDVSKNRGTPKWMVYHGNPY